MLSQLVYVSERSESSSDNEIDQILLCCEKNNPHKNITGVLLYSDKQFLQLLEGEGDVITSLFQTIKKDTRHTTPMMVCYSPIQQKAFPNWSMATKRMDQGMEVKSNITPEDRSLLSELLQGKKSDGDRILRLLRNFFSES